MGKCKTKKEAVSAVNYNNINHGFLSYFLGEERARIKENCLQSRTYHLMIVFFDEKELVIFEFYKIIGKC